MFQWSTKTDTQITTLLTDSILLVVSHDLKEFGDSVEEVQLLDGKRDYLY